MNSSPTFNFFNQAELQSAFFKATFTVMGHIAKADGRVSEKEIEMAISVMQQLRLNESQRQDAIRYFNQGKSPDFDFNL